MKNLIKICLAIVWLFQATYSASAGPKNLEFTVENLYRHFETSTSPKKFFIEAQKAAMFLSKECQKGKTPCDRALEEFNKPFSRFETCDGFHAHTNILDKSTGTVVAHPNPVLHQKLLNKPGLDKVYQDHRGLLIMVNAFDKFRKNGKWAWFDVYSTWVVSKTKLLKPLFILNLLIQIPGTKYQVQHMMPFRASSTKDIEDKIAAIEKETEKWVIMEW